MIFHPPILSHWQLESKPPNKSPEPTAVGAVPFRCRGSRRESAVAQLFSLGHHAHPQLHESLPAAAASSGIEKQTVMHADGEPCVVYVYFYSPFMYGAETIWIEAK